MSRYGTTFVNRLFEYMQTLHALRDLRPRRLYPGHGPVIEDGEDYLSRYIGGWAVVILVVVAGAVSWSTPVIGWGCCARWCFD